MIQFFDKHLYVLKDISKKIAINLSLYMTDLPFIFRLQNICILHILVHVYELYEYYKYIYGSIKSYFFIKLIACITTSPPLHILLLTAFVVYQRFITDYN